VFEYNWDRIEEVFKYVVFDQRGYVYAYMKEPHIKGDTWQKDLGYLVLGTLPEWISVEHWRESLVVRPHPKKRWELAYNIDRGSLVFDRKYGRVIFATFGAGEDLEEIVKVLNEYEETTHD
jgi:hypothetical protein